MMPSQWRQSTSGATSARLRVRPGPYSDAPLRLSERFADAIASSTVLRHVRRSNSRRDATLVGGIRRTGADLDCDGCPALVHTDAERPHEGQMGDGVVDGTGNGQLPAIRLNRVLTRVDDVALSVRATGRHNGDVGPGSSTLTRT